MIAFISGHLDLTIEEFLKYYVPLICRALDNGDGFIVGDAKGADSEAQKFIYNVFCEPVKTEDGTWTGKTKIDDRYKTRMVVYHMFTTPRNNEFGFITKGGFKTDEERDVAMTEASDYDIAWVRPGREKSGTAKNIARRKKKQSLGKTI